MRGGVTYNEAMFMSYGEREILSEFLKERLKEAFKLPNPVF